MRSEYFYRGFDTAASIGKLPNDHDKCIKAYKSFRGLTEIDGCPELGEWIYGWNMFYILKFNRDGLNNDMHYEYYSVAIVFDLSKLDSDQVFRLWYWIQDEHGVNTEQWSEGNHAISEYGTGIPGRWDDNNEFWIPGDWDGQNYWLISYWGFWKGDLLRFLINEGYPDESYRVVPDPNL